MIDASVPQLDRPLPIGPEMLRDYLELPLPVRVLCLGSLVFCVATYLIALVFMQGMSTLPIYMRQSGFSFVQFGRLMSINGLLMRLSLKSVRWHPAACRENRTVTRPRLICADCFPTDRRKFIASSVLRHFSKVT